MYTITLHFVKHINLICKCRLSTLPYKPYVQNTLQNNKWPIGGALSKKKKYMCACNTTDTLQHQILIKMDEFIILVSIRNNHTQLLRMIFLLRNHGVLLRQKNLLQ